MIGAAIVLAVLALVTVFGALAIKGLDTYVDDLYEEGASNGGHHDHS